MATQRKPYASPADSDISEKVTINSPATGKSDIAPAVPSHVIYTLLSFTLAMITLPIGTYFFVVNFVFVGNATYSGALAAVMANVVLIAYVIMAMREDQSERLEQEAEEKRKKGL